MRRFVGLVILLLFTIPFGISISGCAKKSASVQFCNGGESGPVVGQVTTITLSPKVYGVSLDYGAIGQISPPTATDCKGNTVSVPSYTYGTTDKTLSIVDVQPSTGRICAGKWNRNSGAGVADYTYCIPATTSGTYSIIASGGGASSNALPVYVHPTVTNVVLGAPSSSDPTDPSNCNGSDPATNCSPAAFSTSATSCTLSASGNGCCATPTTPSTAFVANACLSQGTTGQLAARVYTGTGASRKNISCQVGHLTYTPETASVVSIDENGIATAQAPGSTIITSNLANAGSSAGFFSTCPPISIELSAPGVPAGTTPTVSPNNQLPLTTIVKDKNQTVLTGLTLEFVSTTPTTIPGKSTLVPLFPGAAGITAICQPPSCNPAPFNQIGLFGNGTPVLSNELNVVSPGKNSTALYIGSTDSQYIVPVDFTTNVIGTPVRLPYVPNSMVISNDGSAIYMGSANELMTFNALSNSLTTQDSTVMGKVLAVSPDNTTLVVTDPTRQLVYLYSSTGPTSTTSAVQTQYGGIGTHAEFSPDSQTVYITTTTNQLLVHSTLTGWSSITLANPATDVAITVPSAGAFLAGTATTARGQCPVTTSTTVNGLPTTSNVFYPEAYNGGRATDVLAATNDGLHILGATLATDSLTDYTFAAPGVPTGPCDPAGTKFQPTEGAPLALSGVVPTAITGIDPTSDSSVAFITYTGTGSVVPYYAPGTGTVANIPLLPLTSTSSTPIAPVAGVVSADNATFFVGTTGDNSVHLIDRSTLTDQPAKGIFPNLPGINGGVAIPNLLVQRPRKSTS
jgi:trimeric autotransporter adhesin